MSRDEPNDETAQGEQPARRDAPDWWIYRGTGRPLKDIRLSDILPPPPPWRDFQGGPLPLTEDPPGDEGESRRRLGAEYQVPEREVDPREADMVNAALFLRRPLLVTGPPGVGKSSLAYRISRELRLGRVLKWPIVSRTMLHSGLYNYDAIGRAEAAGARRASAQRAKDADGTKTASPRGAQAVRSQDHKDQGLPEALSADPEEAPIGNYIRLGPLGTAFLPRRLPRVVLIDELDKSDPDLPNDLLSLFEDGEFVIPELERLRSQSPEVTVLTADPGGSSSIVEGRVRCLAFPVVVITSNGEREFPAAFLRRCLRLEMREPDSDRLATMVAAHLLDPDGTYREQLIRDFMARSRDNGGLPSDKLLDAVYLATSGAYDSDDPAWPRLLDSLWRRLSSEAT